MLGEMLAALLKVIDLVLKKKEYRDQFDDDKIVENIVRFIISLEDVEKQAESIRMRFFYMERDSEIPGKDRKHRERLLHEIPKQLETIEKLDEYYQQFNTVFDVYLENNQLPKNIENNYRDYLLHEKSGVLGNVLGELRRNKNNIEYIKSEIADAQLEQIHYFKNEVSKLIREQVPFVDFAKWFRREKRKTFKELMEEAARMK